MPSRLTLRLRAVGQRFLALHAEAGAEGAAAVLDRQVGVVEQRRAGMLELRLGQLDSDVGFRLLHDPASLWICVSLALMMSSVVCTLSRGGFLALIGGFLVCFIIQVAGAARFIVGTILVSLALTLGLLGWFGLERVEARYGTIWSGKALNESRLTLWSAAWSVVKDFPVWGTGFGTYQVIDPLYRTSAEVADLTIDHLHNDHLEMLAEGGLVGLGLSWLMLGLVFWLGLKVVRQGTSLSGIVLGEIFSITTLALHCTGDFCVSVPAITLLASVISARFRRNASAPVPFPSVGRGEARKVCRREHPRAFSQETNWAYTPCD